MTKPIHRGDLYWLTPDPALGSGVAHPYLVISDDVFNHSRIDTAVVCALTSNLRRANEPGNVLLEAGEGDLPKCSVLVVSQVCTVQKADLSDAIGRLGVHRVEQVLRGMRFLQRLRAR